MEIFATLKVKLKQSMIYKKCRLYCFEFGALAQGIIVKFGLFSVITDSELTTFGIEFIKIGQAVPN